jgi:HK97 family phage portal protein
MEQEMPNWLNRLAGGRDAAPVEQKSGGTQMMILSSLGDPNWSRRGFASLANEGFAKNPIVYRCVRMIAEAAAQVPLGVTENGTRLTDHPVLSLLAHPNPNTSGAELFESMYAYLQTAGNAYLQAVVDNGEVKGLFELRPDRMQAVPGPDGYAMAYNYTSGGRTTRLDQLALPIPQVLHLKLFHPLDDTYGMAPLQAAQQSLDIHNAAASWNKSLLDNAARPSGALVYSSAAGSLTSQQFERLKEELELGFQGAANAGRPMVLEGGLDWKTIAMSPKDMDLSRPRTPQRATSRWPSACRPCCSASPATTPIRTMSKPTNRCGARQLSLSPAAPPPPSATGWPRSMAAASKSLPTSTTSKRWPKIAPQCGHGSAAQASSRMRRNGKCWV